MLTPPVVPPVTRNESGVPTAFLRHCGTWEGTARRVSPTGELLDSHLVRVQIEIDDSGYVQTNTVRSGTPREVTASYYGQFENGVLVFPLTDEVYTLGGDKAAAFSGTAWALTDDLILYQGSRTLNGKQTSYNEVIAFEGSDRRIRTTQLFEDGNYKLVTMIDEIRVS
ncbi:MAG: DUF3598 family protein [Synechococcus sp.]